MMEGGEFSSSQFLTHLINEGIIRQVSSPKTPNKMEWLNANIETLLNWAYQCYFILQYQRNNGLRHFIVNYLINRLQSVQLGMKSHLMSYFLIRFLIILLFEFSELCAFLC